MKESKYHLLNWMHEEATEAGHWCSSHLVHNRHFWLYLLIALAVVAILAAMLIFAGSAQIHPELRSYPYMYGMR